MAESNPNYPRPEIPRSFSEVLAKALAEPDYAAFIHSEVARARTARTEEERREAVDNIDHHFKLSSGELTSLGLPVGFSSGPCRCTNTRPTTFLLDFATMTRTWPPDEEAS